MYIIVEHLNKYSHLMNLGRYEFTLFLKGTGLPLEEALKFYQIKFAQKCTLEKFEKQGRMILPFHKSQPKVTFHVETELNPNKILYPSK